jgi:mono/diheme cytochrome c family protein
MNKKWLFILIAGVMIFTLAACAGTTSDITIPPKEDTGADTPADQNDQTTTINAADIFAQRCSGCHGADREGGGGPALLPGVLTKDPSAYINTITNGSGSMPAWGSRLSAAEINALVEFILSK